LQGAEAEPSVQVPIRTILFSNSMQFLKAFISNFATQALLEPCEGELGCVLWDDAVCNHAQQRASYLPIQRCRCCFFCPGWFQISLPLFLCQCLLSELPCASVKVTRHLVPNAPKCSEQSQFALIFCRSGTGAVGCGLLHSQAFRCSFLVYCSGSLRLIYRQFSRIIISDLPTLLPLLECNSHINNQLCGSGSRVVPRAIDWCDPSAYEDLKAGCRL
jgi:hypothetical protein